MSVKLRASGWELGGKPLPWLWGQINYWDVDRRDWRDVLRAYQERGNAVLSASVLPRVHQTGPAQFDFGAARPQLDLAAFAREAGEIGLKLVLWLGPRDVPGAAAAGYPEDLLRDERVLARGADGRFLLSPPCAGGDVFCLPSLVSSVLHQALGPFSHQVARVLAPLVHPDGPVIGLGLTQAPGWWPGLPAFAADYHPEALTRYREFLRQRYHRPAALNAAYGTAYSAFDEVDPPRELGSADPRSPRLLDWARAREDYFVHAAERLHALFSPVAQDRVPLFLAALPTAGRPFHAAELERTQCFAYALPEPPSGMALGSELELWGAQAGQVRFLAWFQARPEVPSDEDGEATYGLSRRLAAGVRAWDALAPAGSGAIPGFLMDRRGHLRRDQDGFWESLREQARSEGFLQSQAQADVVLLTLPDQERAIYLQTPPAPRHDLVDLPIRPADPVLAPDTRDYVQSLGQLARWLDEGQYAWVRAEGDGDWDRFTDKQMLVVPGAVDLPAEVQARLAAALEQGLNLVLAGPLPAHPEGATHPPLADWAAGKVKPLRVPQRGRGKAPKPGRLHHLPEPNAARFTRLLKQLGVPRELTLDASGLRLTFHRFRNRLFVAVDNPGPEAVETIARREGKFVLKDFWQTRKFLGGNQEIRLTLPARTVKFWELIPC